MKPIIDLIQRLSLSDPQLRYPEYAPADGKIHILYMAVPFNATGLYRCILPAIMLNNTTTHCAIINDMQDWSTHDRFRTQGIPITDQLIRWAHYIVFPTVFSKNKIFIKLINTFKNLNPSVKIFIDVDDDIMNISPHHPQFKRYSPWLIANVLKNINSCHGITCTHDRLCNCYSAALNFWFKKTPKPVFYALPNLMSRLTIPEGPKLPTQNSKPLTIGITINNTQGGDMLLVLQLLKNILKKYADKVQIYIFGWDGKQYNGKYFIDVFKNLKHVHIKPVILTDYFTALQNLNYDFAIMPLVDNQFNRMKSNHKLLQYAMFGIPAIAPDIPPYNEAPIPGKTPIPYLKVKNGEWEEKISFMIENETERKALASKARAIVKNYFIEDNINIWQECFAQPVQHLR